MCIVLLKGRSIKYTGEQKLSESGIQCKRRDQEHLWGKGSKGASHHGKTAPAEDQPVSRPGGRVCNEVEKQGRVSGDVTK